jgi:hypothetical protein
MPTPLSLIKAGLAFAGLGIALILIANLHFFYKHPLGSSYWKWHPPGSPEAGEKMLREEVLMHIGIVSTFVAAPPLLVGGLLWLAWSVLL